MRYCMVYVYMIIFLFNFEMQGQEKDAELVHLMKSYQYDGVLLMYNYQKNTFITSHRNKTMRRVLPASTFKIFNSLVFFDQGLVKSTDHTLVWDGVEYMHKGQRVPSWYQDSNLEQAFKNSTVWYFEKLSASIDFSVYRDLLQQNQYGKTYSKQREDIDFWNKGNSLGISAQDQINFLIKLKEGKTTFLASHESIVKEMMVERRTEQYVLRSKTGWATTDDTRFQKGKDLGWYVGWVETDLNAYFFAIRLEKDNDDERPHFPIDRKKIVWEALKLKYGIEIE